MKIKFNFAIEIYKMKVRLFFRTSIIFFLFSFSLFSQQQYEVVKSDAEWKKQLDEMSYLVLRKAYTERPYTGKYDNFYEEGTYHCAGCDEALYKSCLLYTSPSPRA